MPARRPPPAPDYLHRVTQPVLMLNGKYDMFFAVETAQKPIFHLLGTPDHQPLNLATAIVLICAPIGLFMVLSSRQRAGRD
jgi:hypothetical protein